MMNNIINLVDLAKKQMNEEGKELRCLMYTKDADVFIEYENFDSIYKKYEHPVEVYQPTKEQEKLILDYLNKNLTIDKDKIDAKIEGQDFIIVFLEELTNVKLGYNLDNPEHLEIVKNIVSNPTRIIKAISEEFDRISNDIFTTWFKKMKEYSKVPIEVREAIEDVYINNKQLNDNEDDLNG